MIDLTVAQIAAIVGGELADVSAEDAAGLHVTGTVEFDSRKVTSGGLFLALPGARVDGHDHAAAAVAAGAVAVLAARPVGVPAIVVPAAAEAHRRGTGRCSRARQRRRGRGGAGRAGQARRRGGRRVGGRRPDDRRHHRLVGQDVDQRPAGRGARPARRSDCATRIVQQRARPPVDGAARHAQHRLSDPRAVGPPPGQHRRAGRDRAACHRGGAQCRHRTPRRIRLAGSHRRRPKANCHKLFRLPAW